MLPVVLLAAVVCLLNAEETPRTDTIYGDDDRRDLYQVDNVRVLALADSTVALFRADDIQPDETGNRARLNTRSYGESMGLCRDEPFYEQRNGAFCSGSLVGPDLIMTAGHCIDSFGDCKNVKFVFEFGIREAGSQPDNVPASEVYGCAELLGREEESRGPDWALVRLDRRVENHKPLELNRTGMLGKDELLFVIGHPAGLPTKVAGGATVRDPDPQGFFVANLDTYGGNSGSAVFNARTGLVEGILVRGEVDYVMRGDCRVSNVCPADGCRGEDVTKISALSERIPSIKAVSFNTWMSRPGPALSALLEQTKAR